MGWRIGNALFWALIIAYGAERYWLRIGYRRSMFGYLAQELLEKDLRAGRWIFRVVFLLVFTIHFFVVARWSD